MSGFTLPTISNDYKTHQPFVGAIHPSLRQLNDYITRKFKQHIVEIETQYHKDQAGKFVQLWPELAHLTK